MREVTVDIEPIELCADCPKRDRCEMPAKLAVDSYMKVAFWTLEEPEGDPEFVASRHYIDEQGNRTEYFLDGSEPYIRACKGPVVKRRLLRPNETRCAAQEAHRGDVEAAIAVEEAAIEAARIERNGEPVFLTQEELRAFAAFTPDELVEIGSISVRELNQLILFCREHPDQGELLKQLRTPR